LYILLVVCRSYIVHLFCKFIKHISSIQVSLYVIFAYLSYFIIYVIFPTIFLKLYFFRQLYFLFLTRILYCMVLYYMYIVWNDFKIYLVFFCICKTIFHYFVFWILYIYTVYIYILKIFSIMFYFFELYIIVIYLFVYIYILNAYLLISWCIYLQRTELYGKIMIFCCHTRTRHRKFSSTFAPILRFLSQGALSNATHECRLAICFEYFSGIWTS
jgi:hypothetical protein